MIAYNNTWLNNLLVRRQADKALQEQCISQQEKEQLYIAYPAGFYTPNGFVRIGLFILTLIIVLFSMGLVSLLFISAFKEEQYGLLLVVFGMGIYAGLEWMVTKKHYTSGVDDALMWLAAACLITGLNITMRLSYQANAILFFAVALFLFVRFTSLVMAAVAFLALLAFVLVSLSRLGTIAKAITPFVLMGISIVIYFFVGRLQQRPTYQQYTKGLIAIAVTALVCVYAAVNYFVVREASVALFDLDLKQGESIPLAWLFWLCTVAIPLIYIASGVQQKNMVLIRTGLVLIIAVVLTVRHYYHFMPLETAMVTGGVFLIGIAWALIKYLEQPRYGFTAREQDDPSFVNRLHIESLVIAQTFSASALPADTGTRFGGGTGGGGGATGEF